MNSIYFGLITLSFMVGVAVFILVMIELRGAVRSLNELVRSTDQLLKPTLEEVQLSLRSLRGVTDNVAEVTEDVKALSGSVRAVGDNVRHVSDLVGTAASFTNSRFSGYRAAVAAAAEVLIKGFISRKMRE